MLRWFLLLLAAIATQSAADPSPVSRAFQVTAVVAQGCAFGTTDSDSSVDLGTIDFGDVTSLSPPPFMASSLGNGSIVLTCTPGMSVRISIGNGLNGSSTSERSLKSTSGNELLGYQLYTDSAFTQIWGSGSNGVAIGSFPMTTQTYTVYARLLPRAGLPPVGEYRDTVTVELVY